MCKSVGDDLLNKLSTIQPAVVDVSVDTRDSLSTSETVTDETVLEIHGPEFIQAKPSDEPTLFTALKIQTPTVINELNQVLDQVELIEFGPAEWAIRELATINVLARHGISVEQVTYIPILYYYICNQFQLCTFFYTNIILLHFYYFILIKMSIINII